MCVCTPGESKIGKPKPVVVVLSSYLILFCGVGSGWSNTTRRGYSVLCLGNSFTQYSTVHSTQFQEEMEGIMTLVSCEVEVVDVGQALCCM
jgi:muramidase (phage lysozyme)